MIANKIIGELKHHAPFTAFGAATGIIFMVVFRNIGHESAHRLFYIFHPLHVVFSAIATTAMYKIYQCSTGCGKRRILPMLVVGYFGAVGIATLSDSVIPFLGEKILDLPHARMHAGFIEEWWLINPAAFLGIVIAYFWTKTEVPHAGHVLISTWASLFHMTMAMGDGVTLLKYAAVFVFLFISVWTPCCVSDIAFPLFFTKNSGLSREKTCKTPKDLS